MSAIIRLGLMLALLLVVSGLLDYLPGAGILVAGRIALSVLLRLGISIAMIALMLMAYRRTVAVVGWGVRTLLRLQPGDRSPDESVSMLARSSALLLYACLVYWALMRSFAPLVSLLTAARWPITAVQICSLAVAVAAIVGLLRGAWPIFGDIGAALAGRITRPPEGGEPTKCPACGVLNVAGSRFCAYCGSGMPQ